MRSKTIFGALLVSVALCSQGFSFELLDRMLGLNGGGCGECNPCAKVAPCEPCAKTCAPAACCEKATCNPCCKKYHATPVRDLFDNVKDMFEAKGCQCEPVPCCEAKGCCPEPACCGKTVKCHKVRCCEKPSCKACEPACKACEPACCEKPCKPKCHKLYRRPVVELLENLFGNDECNEGCEAGCGCGGTTVPGKAPATGPAKAPEQAAPLPAAPKADKDPSASIQSRGIYQASRSLVRN